jgi:uncharacterized membrane protein YuzA (DUF378 family)
MGLFRSILHILISIAQFLVLVGGLAWGLIGYNKTDAIVMIFPRQFVRYIHISVGIAALFLIFTRFL